MAITRTKSIDYRWQTIKDLPFQLKDCYLVLRKRRYACSCGKRFYENYVFLPRYLQHTNRLTHRIAHMLRNTESMKSIAEKSNVSPSTVAMILDTIQYPCQKLQEAIAIDEFKGDAETGKFQCILVNPKNRGHTSYVKKAPKASNGAGFKESHPNT